MEDSFTFADLFAGIGGFHAALAPMGGRCIYAVEIDPRAAEVYQLNWDTDPSTLKPLGDITQHANDDEVIVPEHDVLVAGFPCQPFSKSGAQRGMEEARGTLFWNIAKIIEKCKPAVVLLENVRNLAGPRHRHELEVIWETLHKLGYKAHVEVFSPHLLPKRLGGAPHARDRVFITATRVSDGKGTTDSVGEPPALPQVKRASPVDGWNPQSWDLERDLPLDPNERVVDCDLTDAEKAWIDAWDDFVKAMRDEFERRRAEEIKQGKEPKERRLPGHPLWVDSWKPGEVKIAHGTPGWKEDFLKKNANFYTDYRDVLDAWIERSRVRTEAFPPSRRKFEWQAQETRTLWECVIHLRPSGIRAKKPTYLPALVAITQTSIIGPRRRRLSPREAARLQGLPEEFKFGKQSAAATYRQLGNGVNVGVVQHVLVEHVRRDEELLKESAPALLRAVLRFAEEREGYPS